MRVPRKMRAAGFTFIELLTATGVLAVLLLISFSVYRNYTNESRTTDAINALKAVELEVRAPARFSGGLHACDNSLVMAQNLRSDYLDLDISQVPNDAANPLGPQGFGAVLTVGADIARHGGDGVAVAALFLEEMKNQRAADVIGEVVTDSAVAFSIRLSPAGQPYCDTALASGGVSTSAVAGLNRPPVAGKDIDLGSTPEDTAFSIPAAKLIGSSFDPDMDPLTVTAVTVANGKVTGDAATGFVYTPVKDFHGDNVRLNYEISDGSETSPGTAFLDVTSVVDDPIAELTLSAEQQIMNTGTDGRAIVSRLQTGGEMRAVTMEFSVVGRQGGDAKASTGPVIFNYGTQDDNNAISAWRPSNFTIAIGGQNYATGINIADGSNHRVTISWDSASGVLKVFDNGRLVKTENDVLKGQAVAGDGHLVIGQKMNQPRTGGGWNANEHYSGQVFGTTLATHVYTDSEIAGAPLYSQSQGIVADLRNEGGALQDMTGRHTVDMQGNYSTITQPVDTALALIPPGAEVRFGIRAAVGDSDSLLQSIELGGISGFNITDGVNSGTGTVDVTTWNLAAIRAQMPAGFKSNPTITLKVTAVEDGVTASAEDTKVLNMQPAA